MAYGSGVVATAVERRLGACARVELVPVGDTPRRLRRSGRCDAVLMDPFLTEHERRRVRDAVASVPRPPVLVHLRHEPGRVEADVDDWGDGPRADAVRDVVAALTR